MVFLVLSACTKKEDTQTIKMGFTPSESTEKVSLNGKVLADLLEKKTGLKFKIYVASDYTALIEAMKTGQVDVGWLAPFAYVLAETKADARVSLKAVRHGQASQYSAIIVKDSTNWKTIQDVKGKNIAWIDPSSSSGHIVPKSALLAAGINLEGFFGNLPERTACSVREAGPPIAQLVSVVQGKCTPEGKCITCSARP